MKLNINGFEWTLLFVPDNDKRLGTVEEGYMNLGNTEFDKLMIAINSDVDEQVQRSTIIHELAHAYVASIGIDDDVFSEEGLCKFIGCNLLTIYGLYEQVLKKKEV